MSGMQCDAIRNRGSLTVVSTPFTCCVHTHTLVYTFLQIWTASFVCNSDLCVSLVYIVGAGSPAPRDQDKYFKQVLTQSRTHWTSFWEDCPTLRWADMLPKLLLTRRLDTWSTVRESTRGFWMVIGWDWTVKNKQRDDNWGSLQPTLIPSSILHTARTAPDSTSPSGSCTTGASDTKRCCAKALGWLRARGAFGKLDLKERAGNRLRFGWF